MLEAARTEEQGTEDNFKIACPGQYSRFPVELPKQERKTKKPSCVCQDLDSPQQLAGPLTSRLPRGEEDHPAYQTADGWWSQLPYDKSPVLSPCSVPDTLLWALRALLLRAVKNFQGLFFRWGK